MLDPTTQFIVDLFVLLAAAVLAGEISVHLGQAALVGQLLAGLVLGPTLLGPYFGLNGPTQGLTAVETLAVIFVLFLAGLEVVPRTIFRMEIGNVVLGVGIFVVPLTLGSIIVGPVLGVGYPENLYVALALSITALPVMSIMLSEFGLTRSRLGTWLMNAALINELAAVSVFAIFLRLGPTPLGDTTAILIGVVSLSLFLSTMLTIHQALAYLRRTFLWERMSHAFASTWRTKQGEFALLMVLVVGATLYSQFLGLTYVVGAFYAGLLVTRESAGREAHRSFSQIFDAMSWGFFIPLFFALVGVGMNLHDLASPGLIVAFVILLVVAAFAKIGPGFGIARGFGWTTNDALVIGHFVNSRGAVESRDGGHPPRFRPHHDRRVHPDRRHRARHHHHRTHRGRTSPARRPGPTRRPLSSDPVPPARAGTPVIPLPPGRRAALGVVGGCGIGGSGVFRGGSGHGPRGPRDRRAHQE